MNPVNGNLLDEIPAHTKDEDFADLVVAHGIKIERIISTGQATKPGEWLDQERAEWVLLVSGSAALLFEDEDAPRVLQAGDYLLIDAHRKHRVEWTAQDEPTVWLAAHFDG